MINVTQDRDKYILKPTVPANTDRIDYEVTIDSNVVFVGKTRYFGGDYEVDCTDWIESYIDSKSRTDIQVGQITVYVTFTFWGSTYSQTTMSCSYHPEGTNLPVPLDDENCRYLYLELSNCGFVHYDSQYVKFRVPLLCRDKKLIGGAVNRLEKVKYIDRYGDDHNGVTTNKYEIECYVDPDWLNINTPSYGINNYRDVMLALQNSKNTIMRSFGTGDFIKIPGIDTASMTYLEGKVKDMEQVEVRSSYDAGHRLPTLKIIFEVYK